MSLVKLFRIPVHISLIVLTSVISIVVSILYAFRPEIIPLLALQPEAILQGHGLWTIITHFFVHGSIFHLLINMFVLFSLGGLTERIIGKRRFVWLYLVSGLAAGILSVVLAGFFGFGIWAKVFGTPDMYMVGASGAIFAIAGLLMVLLPRLKFSIIFLPFFSLPAYIMVPLVLLLTWFISIISGLPVGNVAHFGGFLVGLLYGWFLRVKYPQKTMLLQRYFR